MEDTSNVKTFTEKKIEACDLSTVNAASGINFAHAAASELQLRPIMNSWKARLSNEWKSYQWRKQ